MRVVVAPDKFKGSLTAAQVAAAVRRRAGQGRPGRRRRPGAGGRRRRRDPGGGPVGRLPPRPGAGRRADGRAGGHRLRRARRRRRGRAGRRVGAPAAPRRAAGRRRRLQLRHRRGDRRPPSTPAAAGSSSASGAAPAPTAGPAWSRRWAGGWSTAAAPRSAGGGAALAAVRSPGPVRPAPGPRGGRGRRGLRRRQPAARAPRGGGRLRTPEGRRHRPTSPSWTPPWPAGPGPSQRRHRDRPGGRARAPARPVASGSPPWPCSGRGCDRASS